MADTGEAGNPRRDSLLKMEMSNVSIAMKAVSKLSKEVEEAEAGLKHVIDESDEEEEEVGEEVEEEEENKEGGREKNNERAPRGVRSAVDGANGAAQCDGVNVSNGAALQGRRSARTGMQRESREEVVEKARKRVEASRKKLKSCARKTFQSFEFVLHSAKKGILDALATLEGQYIKERDGQGRCSSGALMGVEEERALYVRRKLKEVVEKLVKEVESGLLRSPTTRECEERGGNAWLLSLSQRQALVRWCNECLPLVGGALLKEPKTEEQPHTPTHVRKLIKAQKMTELCSMLEREQRKEAKDVLEELRNAEAEGITEDVVARSTLVLLTCPLSHSRISVPTRTLHCTHPKCFDLCSFLETNKAYNYRSKNGWRCPHCWKSAQWSELIFDAYIASILRETTSESVIILSNGEWKEAEAQGQPENVVNLDEGEDEGAMEEPIVEDVIALSSSSEEEGSDEEGEESEDSDCVIVEMCDSPKVVSTREDTNNDNDNDKRKDKGFFRRDVSERGRGDHRGGRGRQRDGERGKTISLPTPSGSGKSTEQASRGYEENSVQASARPCSRPSPVGVAVDIETAGEGRAPSAGGRSEKGELQKVLGGRGGLGSEEPTVSEELQEVRSSGRGKWEGLGSGAVGAEEKMGVVAGEEDQEPARVLRRLVSQGVEGDERCSKVKQRCDVSGLSQETRQQRCDVSGLSEETRQQREIWERRVKKRPRRRHLIK